MSETFTFLLTKQTFAHDTMDNTTICSFHLHLPIHCKFHKSSFSLFVWAVSL